MTYRFDRKDRPDLDDDPVLESVWALAYEWIGGAICALLLVGFGLYGGALLELVFAP